MKQSYFRLLLVGGLCLMASSVYAGSCKLVATPDNAKVQMVAPDMKLNGVETNIRAFNSGLSVEGVLGFYRKLWAGLANSTRPGSLEQNMDEWKLISTIENECFTTVQVRSDGNGSYALVSVTKKPSESARLEKLGAGFPSLPGSTVLNDFDYADGIRNARTIVVTNRSAMNANLQFYRNEMKSRGWVPVLERQPESKSGVTHVLVLKKGLEEASLVLTHVGGQVQIVANIVDRP